jgi:glycosyltransferase involved in cell wall biosynthesis
MNSKKPSISVAINNFNNESYLEECIESVLFQTEKPSEIIIVDDGSTDNSRNVLERYKKEHSFIKIVYQENRGQLAAVASGIQSAASDVVALLDSDDAYDVDYISNLLIRWQEFPKTDLMYCRYKSFGDDQIIKEGTNSNNVQLDPEWLGPVDTDKPYQYGRSNLLAYYFPWYYCGNITSTISIKKSHFNKINLDILLNDKNAPKHCADLALLFCSALSNGYKTYIPDRNVKYRIHSNQITNKKSTDKVYEWEYSNLFIKEKLRSRFTFLDKFKNLLENELKAIPQPSEAHIGMYKYCIYLNSNNNLHFQNIDLKLQHIKETFSWKVTYPIRFFAKYILFKIINRKYIDL